MEGILDKTKDMTEYEHLLHTCTKILTLHQYLHKGMVLVAFKNENAKIPSYLKGDETVVLRFGWNTSPPIPDLEVTVEGISATLAFNGTPFHCYVPWKSVFIIRIDGEEDSGQLWAPYAPTPKSEEVKSKKVGKFTVIEGGESE